MRQLAGHFDDYDYDYAFWFISKVTGNDHVFRRSSDIVFMPLDGLIASCFREVIYRDLEYM